MEEFSTLIWLGIAIVWFLTRLIARGARKAARTHKKRVSPGRSPLEAVPTQTESSYSGRSGEPPPPIVPH
jgi:hypothetical protein